MPPFTTTENAPLAHYTTLRVGGPARHLVEASTEEQTLEALDGASSRGLPVFVLGSGSNVLFADAGFPGLVLRIATRGIEAPGANLLTAAAGEEWDALVRFSVKLEMAGIECLSGIPGTAGATPVQNVGAYGEEVGDTIRSVRVLDRSDWQDTGTEQSRMRLRIPLVYLLHERSFPRPPTISRRSRPTPCWSQQAAWATAAALLRR